MLPHLRVRKRQPQGLAMVQHRSGITSGLAALVSGSTMFDVVGSRFPEVNSLTDRTTAPHGVSPVYDGSKYAQFRLRPTEFAGPKTLLVVASVDEGTGNRIVLGLGDSGSSANVAEIYRTPTGMLSYIEVGAGSSSGNTMSAATGVTVGEIFVAVARTLAADHRTLSVRTPIWNETQRVINSTNANPATAVDSLVLGAERYNGGVAAHLNGKVFLAGCWNRAITDAEEERLLMNPWQLLESSHLPIPTTATGVPMLTALPPLSPGQTTAALRYGITF